MPGHFKAYFNRGFAYDKLGLYDQAIKDYSSALEIDPSNVYAYYNRGYLFYILPPPPKLCRCNPKQTQPFALPSQLYMKATLRVAPTPHPAPLPLTHIIFLVYLLIVKTTSRKQFKIFRLLYNLIRLRPIFIIIELLLIKNKRSLN